MKLLFFSALLLLSLLSSTGASEGEGECRRALWESPDPSKKRYISYEALRGDNVPCTRAGVPYYNCHVLPKANPYARGCSVITACRG